MRKRISFIWLLGIASSLLYAQDIHFSQFYQTPLLINPANTAVFNGDLRASLIYRNQWANLSPFTTYGMSFDMGFLKKKMKDKYLGAGLVVFRDIAGASKLSTTIVNLSISSVVTINDHNDISAGIQGGFAQKSIAGSNFEWGSQYDGSGYNSAVNSNEASTYDDYIYGDFSAGVKWVYSKSSSAKVVSSERFNVTLGFAVLHINAPKQEFDLEKLHREFITNAGMHLGLKGSSFSLIPSIIYMQQGPLKEINAGMLIRYAIKEETKYTGLLKETAFFFGAYYRFGDAVVPTILFEIANYAIGLSYDINVSGLKEASNGQGGFEISLRYINPNPFKYGAGSKYRRRSLY
ncbi:MAG TPA: type IX secretion system membrane protein PorP/SprF [Flavobacteriales bacterium]|nr:type IX secretion system membrane protein PorP/SprF [Flavobacteriales bacterium]HIA11033.1 type IX secretion system membrane protein PorP/SprF [Flavobacteriales bacterium]